MGRLFEKLLDYTLQFSVHVVLSAIDRPRLAKLLVQANDRHCLDDKVAIISLGVQM